MDETITDRSLEDIHWNDSNQKMDGSSVMIGLELFGVDPILALSRSLYEEAFSLENEKVTEGILPLVVALEHEAENLKKTLDRLANEWGK